MTGKKIEFFKKPNIKEADKFIDNWVTGSTKSEAKVTTKLKRTTIYLPENIHHQLKLKAVEAKTTMTEFIIQSIEKNLEE